MTLLKMAFSATIFLNTVMILILGKDRSFKDNDKVNLISDIFVISAMSYFLSLTMCISTNPSGSTSYLLSYCLGFTFSLFIRKTFISIFMGVEKKECNPKSEMSCIEETELLERFMKDITKHGLVITYVKRKLFCSFKHSCASHGHQNHTKKRKNENSIGKLVELKSAKEMVLQGQANIEGLEEERTHFEKSHGIRMTEFQMLKFLMVGRHFEFFYGFLMFSLVKPVEFWLILISNIIFNFSEKLSYANLFRHMEVDIDKLFFKLLFFTDIFFICGSLGGWIVILLPLGEEVKHCIFSTLAGVIAFQMITEVMMHQFYLLDSYKKGIWKFGLLILSFGVLFVTNL